MRQVSILYYKYAIILPGLAASETKYFLAIIIITIVVVKINILQFIILRSIFHSFIQNFVSYTSMQWNNNLSPLNDHLSN